MDAAAVNPALWTGFNGLPQGPPSNVDIIQQMQAQVLINYISTMNTGPAEMNSQLMGSLLNQSPMPIPSKQHNEHNERKRGRRAGASTKRGNAKKVASGSLSGCIIPVSQTGTKNPDLGVVQGAVPLLKTGNSGLSTESYAAANEEQRIDPIDGQVLTESDFMMKHMIGPSFEKAEELWARAKRFSTLPLETADSSFDGPPTPEEDPPADDEPPALLFPLSDDDLSDEEVLVTPL